MVVDELVRLRDVHEGVLSWIRPNFFSLRYELVSSTGPLCRLSVNGIGPDRHVLAEMAESAWRLDLFPLNRAEAPIRRSGGAEPEAFYRRGQPAVVRFEQGGEFRIQPESSSKTVTTDAEGKLVFTVEVVDAFPRWRAEVRLEPHTEAMAELPVLLASACCFLVFP